MHEDGASNNAVPVVVGYFQLRSIMTCFLDMQVWAVTGLGVDLGRKQKHTALLVTICKATSTRAQLGVYNSIKET